MSTAIDHVVVYWRPGCPFCTFLRARLGRSGLPVREVNIWQDPDAAGRVRSVANGNETVPTVFVGEHAMVNPTLGEVRSAVRRYAPHLQPQQRPFGLAKLWRRKTDSGGTR